MDGMARFAHPVGVGQAGCNAARRRSKTARAAARFARVTRPWGVAAYNRRHTTDQPPEVCRTETHRAAGYVAGSEAYRKDPLGQSRIRHPATMKPDGFVPL